MGSSAYDRTSPAGAMMSLLSPCLCVLTTADVESASHVSLVETVLELMSSPDIVGLMRIGLSDEPQHALSTRQCI